MNKYVLTRVKYRRLLYVLGQYPNETSYVCMSDHMVRLPKRPTKNDVLLLNRFTCCSMYSTHALYAY